MFSVIIPGRPCLTDIVAVDGQPGQPTKFAFTFPFSPSFSDVVVFFLPGTVLPQDTAAAIYIQIPESNPSPNGPEFRFLGALANDKPSAIFKARQAETNLSGGSAQVTGMVTLGISIEPIQTVAPQVAALEAQSSISQSSSTALVRQSPQERQQKAISTKVLAQRIIGNAFNFLASFASSDPSNKGQEVVPLKSFQDWWSKFERRVQMDPGFLEREESNI
ncbi:hypothetical protein ASPZODRAFT_54924 [Penicilliopsis zonata CBS 506.65]|uniref:Uncharacterized protein n=1 Tax=Penicilliopsis zonata CBS 506.65 TaxID=1073090 RepID=A0A1L9SUQ0_9EURO|nr:hypothetical protein ASPZODRAFT_54924 [Penicilliopsis zonata CBS 506.65]OJJ50851.1 hypothetical protein ASPZODRAFT_54924 [Penicilliopsis zonata CBS 506.65]